MKRNKEKGFTLIELLAVIVILAIIALITVPIILNVIYKAEKGAFEDAAYGVIDAGRLHFTESLADTNSFTGKTFDFGTKDHGLKISGEKPGGGTLVLDGEGNQTLAVYDTKKRWCALKAKEEYKVKIGDYKGSSCDNTPKPTPVPTPSPDEEVTVIENKTIYVQKGTTVLVKVLGASNYKSSNTSIATVDQTGYMKVGNVVSGSTANITVNAPGKVITVKVIVTPKIENNFYMIYSKIDLEWFRNEINAKTIPLQNAKLMNDIDLLGNESNQWESIGKGTWIEESSGWVCTGCYAGIFDGQNHEIKGIYLNGTSVSGLFYSTGEKSIIKNLTTVGTIIEKSTGSAPVGGIVASSSGMLDNCINKVNITSSSSGAGGITGTVGIGAIIKNSENVGSITVDRFSVGGIIGEIFSSDVQVINNENRGKIEVRNGGSGAGGIVGGIGDCSNVSIINNLNVGPVACGVSGGGIAGQVLLQANNIRFENNENRGSISGSNIGSISGLINQSTNIQYKGNKNNGSPTIVIGLAIDSIYTIQ